MSKITESQTLRALTVAGFTRAQVNDLLAHSKKFRTTLGCLVEVITDITGNQEIILSCGSNI